MNREDTTAPVIKNVDMDQELQEFAINTARQSLEKFNVEKDIAAYVKNKFDGTYDPTWDCIVGKTCESYVTHKTKNFIYFYLGQRSFLIFKSG